MLKAKLAYMAIGAVIASIGWYFGVSQTTSLFFNGLNNVRVNKLIVREQIRVEDENNVVTIIPEGINLYGLRLTNTLIYPGGVKMSGPDTDGDVLYIGATGNLPDYETHPDRIHAVLTLLQPTIEMRKPDGKRITLQIADEALIKISNDGLKSKTVAVD